MKKQFGLMLLMVMSLAYAGDDAAYNKCVKDSEQYCSAHPHKCKMPPLEWCKSHS